MPTFFAKTVVKKQSFQQNVQRYDIRLSMQFIQKTLAIAISIIYTIVCEFILAYKGENAKIKKSGVKFMANIKSAKKRIRVIDKKTARNRRIKNHLKAVLKNFDKAMDEGNFELAQEKLRLAEKKLKQAAAKKTISKNAASRKVSRLTKRFNAAKAAK